jgi:hypothetical protein
MLIARIVASLVLLAAATASAQDVKMFPGTAFPGFDLYEVQATSPDDCAARCTAEPRCSAFTFTFQSNRCAFKWAVSQYDGAARSQSGIIAGRHIAPPGNAEAPAPAPPPPTATPAQPPTVIVVPSGPTTSCSAKGNVACKGCSVTCPAGKQATCTEGEVTTGTPMCWTQTKCECK